MHHPRQDRGGAVRSAPPPRASRDGGGAPPQRVQHRRWFGSCTCITTSNEVRLLLAPRDVGRGIVVHLAESAGVEKAQQRDLGRHIVEVAVRVQGSNPSPTCARGSPVKAATIAVLPAPVFPSSQTTSALASARSRARCVAAPSGPPTAPNNNSLTPARGGREFPRCPSNGAPHRA